MSKIVFLCDHSYFGEDIRTKALGGIETATILLAEAFAKRGHQVEIFNERSSEDTFENVCYRPLKSSVNTYADVAISNISARHLEDVDCQYPIVWQHNRTSVSRIWKRKEHFSLFKVRPIIVNLSFDALKNTPWYIPYRSKHVIPHAIEQVFLTPTEGSTESRQQSAFFASRPSRNLDWVIDMWKNYVFPKLPSAQLNICIPPTSTLRQDPKELESFNILFKGSIPKKELSDLINTCRVLTYPGHINETGCQVALQAIGQGIPIVSCGIGSLKDLVYHGETGFIETNKKEYAEKVIQCLTNSSMWKNLHNATLNHPWRKSYDQRVLDWEKIFT